MNLAAWLIYVLYIQVLSKLTFGKIVSLFLFLLKKKRERREKLETTYNSITCSFDLAILIFFF